ncbi:MAG: hypothetical protein FJ387_25105 [Verrucomicrobia bacterium]|nr:hypothetical protein [Verrucomicrobiota bacterium]
MNPTPVSDPGSQPAMVSPYIYPLDDFYARAGLPLPEIEVIPGDVVPEPYKTLLVHRNDMTPTLEDHYGCDIHLEILNREERGNFYFREVVLRLDKNEQPVEFGANKITLNLFSPPVRRLILEERIPLGHLLKVHKVPHHGCPKAFLRVQSDDLINRSFGLAGTQTLYGRRNTIWDEEERPLSEIVEILPPA